MNNTDIITILTTIQVLPQIFANSVIPLVSINIKPTPRKKLVKENFDKFIPVCFLIKIKDTINMKESNNMYDKGYIL